MIELQDNRLLVSGAVTIATVKADLDASAGRISGESIEVDLSGVREADSSAISLLLEWQRIARRNHCKLRVIHMPENMRSLAKLYGVEELIPMA
jgi:phospholipid transport system transporter-binding protein